MDMNIRIWKSSDQMNLFLNNFILLDNRGLKVNINMHMKLCI